MSRFYEDVSVGDVYRSELGRTITDVDNIWFTLLSMNTNQIHFNEPYAQRTEFKHMLVDSALTLSIVLGLSVADTSQNAAANLAWGESVYPHLSTRVTLFGQSQRSSRNVSRSPVPTSGSSRCGREASTRGARLSSSSRGR